MEVCLLQIRFSGVRVFLGMNFEGSRSPGCFSKAQPLSLLPKGGEKISSSEIHGNLWRNVDTEKKTAPLCHRMIFCSS